MMPYVVISSSEVKCSSHLEPFPFPHYPAKGCGDHRMDREIDSTATSDCGERNSQVRARPYSRTGFLRGHNPFMLAHWLFWQSLGDRRRSAMEGLMVATGASGHGFKWTWFQVDMVSSFCQCWASMRSTVLRRGLMAWTDYGNGDTPILTKYL